MTTETLIEGLNEDLAGELGTIIRYTYQAGKAVGPLGEEVRELLQNEIPDELGHAAYLTDVIIDLGGEPVTDPTGFEKPKGLKGMLEVDLAKEQEDVKRYTAHAEIAGKMGRTEIKVRLEEIAADEGRHAREIRRLLKGFD